MDGYMDRALEIDRHSSEQEINSSELELIYRTYYRSVYNYISFRINNHHDAEDLACAVFENVVRKYPSYRPERGPIEAWLIGIAKNTVTDYFRGGSKRTKDLAVTASRAEQPEELFIRNEGNRALISAMSRLKDKERQVLSMKFATDLRNTDIAVLLGISDSNAGVLIHRAVAKLRKMMEKEDRP